MDWYPVFALFVFLLAFFASERDRAALRVVFCATLGSLLLTETVMRPIVGSWKLVIPGAVETATIIALLRWAANRTGYAQAFLLFIAWWTHLLCYLDLQRGTNLVYDRYETILGAIGAAQLLFFYDTIVLRIRQLGHWCHSFRRRGAGFFRHPGSPFVILHHSRLPRL